MLYNKANIAGQKGKYKDNILVKSVVENRDRDRDRAELSLIVIKHLKNLMLNKLTYGLKM